MAWFRAACFSGRRTWLRNAAGAGTFCAWSHRLDTSGFPGGPVLCHGNAEDGHTHHEPPKKYAATNHSTHMLIGIPKKGRLHDKVRQILTGSGIEFTREDRLDIAHCTNLPISIVFLPASDIATYVGEGNVDLGITGEDVVAESQVEVEVLMKLGFGKCNLSVQAPVSRNITDPRVLAGQRIVTSFPHLTEQFFKQYEEEGVPTRIKCISGSVEAACGLGLADGIVDLVETGTTMRAAGLEEVAVVMRSQAVLIVSPGTQHRDLVELVRKRISGYQTARSWLYITYNVHRENLARVTEITPGKRSPTILQLEEEGWVAVGALVPRGYAPAAMDELEAAGARDILLTEMMSSRLGD